MYMAPGALYLATTRWTYDSATQPAVYPAQMSTDIHKFALQAGTVAYRGTGSVPGHLGWDPNRKSYRMGEHAGDLRVLTFTGEIGWIAVDDAARVPPSPATLTILRERAGELAVVGQLPNARRPALLGRPGEQVHGVRFLGERGALVTFRVVDPLYVLDLSDPTDPKTTGELQVTGFSDDLVPLGAGLVLGVGKEASAQGLIGGVKVALIDLTDAAQPKLLDSFAYGERGSFTALDVSRQGLSLMTVGDTVRLALPMAVYAGGTWSRGLHRFEADLAARALQAKPTVPPAARADVPDLGSDRSVLIGAQIHYLADGVIVSADW
jgi:hypothetical protein